MFNHIIHLIRIYFDLRKHKKMGTILDFKIRWSFYEVKVAIKPKSTIEYIKYDFVINSNGEIK